MIINTLYELDYQDEMSDSNKMLLRWREQEDGQWVRQEKVIEDFEPYCYVLWNETVLVSAKDNTSTRVMSDLLIEHQNTKWMVERLEPTDKTTSDGRPLIKVILRKPWMARIFARRVKPTFEADVPYEDRYLVDKVDEVKPYEMRKLFIDLEALQFKSEDAGPTRCLKPNNPRDFQEINMIGAYDSFSKQRVQWVQHYRFEEEVKVENFDGNDVMIYYFDNEKSLLQSFVHYVEGIDPDVLLAWGGGFYDWPTLFYRLESNGIGANKLSPRSLKMHRHMMAPTFKGHQYRAKAQPIIGRLTISLDVLFKRVYMDSTSSKLPSNRLGDVGEDIFKVGKAYVRDENGEVVLDENGEPIPFKPDFHDPNYDEWIDDYLYYNYRDVELMIDIEEKYNLVRGQQNLQELAKCQYNSTFSGSSYARVYFMRNAGFIQKTGWQETFDEELKGAIIMDPEEMGTIGLHKNVCILDFAGLYPSVMVAYNTSWETKVKEGEERDDDIIGDGCRFRRSPEGVLPKCVKELDVLRDHYKALRQEVANTEGKGSDNYRKWDDAQKTVKRLRATFYGLMGYGRKGYAWGDLDIAKTITYGGRTALLRIQEESEKLGYEVIYGHTDSIFVKLGDDKSIEECAKEAQELGKILTKICQEEVQSDALVVEPEMIMDRFYLPRRNKYAGRIVWQPGTGATPFDIGERPVDSRIKMQGMEAKATNTSKVGKTVQLDAIKMIWDGAKPQEVLAHLKKLIADVKSGAIPVENLVAGASIGQWLPSKKVLASQPKMIEVNVTDEDGNDLMEPATDEEGNIIYKKNGQPKMVAVKESIDATAVHYGEGATNLSARPNPADESDKCYLNLSGDKKGAAWHNIVLANDVYAKMDKGDSYGFLFVKDGPTWIPEGGYVAFHDLSQIKDYTIDIDTIIEKNIIGKLDYVLSGIGLSNSMLREKGEFEGKDLTIEDFQ